jgi:hypothetical protein
MLRIPKHGMIALDMREAFACRAFADGHEPDGYAWPFRHVAIRAFSTVLVMVFLLLLFLL